MQRTLTHLVIFNDRVRPRSDDDARTPLWPPTSPHHRVGLDEALAVLTDLDAVREGIYDLIALRGRLADVIVVPQPQKGDDTMVQATLEVALLETGHPVLVLPPREVEDEADAASPKQ